MARYIALLRGINVGGHRVKMNRLRTLFLDLGLRDVSTVLASGNVLFSSDAEDTEDLGCRIERHLVQALGYEVQTFLRTPAQLADITAVDSPMGAAQRPSPASHHVIFLRTRISDSLRSELAGLESDTDRFTCSESEVHWGIRGKLTDSPLFGGALDRVLRSVPTTMRNMNTVRRIAVRAP